MRGRRLRLVAYAAPLAVAAGIIALLHRYAPPFDYGPDVVRVRELEDGLKAEPCSKPLALQLSELLVEKGDVPGALRRVGSFRGACGDWTRLRWVEYAAHAKQGDWPAAIADASELVARNPIDRDFRAWRAAAHRSAGDWKSTADDFRAALALCPRCESVPFDLAEALRQSGRPCDAVLAVRVLAAAHPERAGTRWKAHRDELERSGCPWPGSEGEAVLDLPAGGAAPVVTARANGREGRFVLDTASLYVVLSPSFAAVAGLVPSDEVLHARTSESAGPVRPAMLESLEIEGLRARSVEAAVTADAADLGGFDGRAGLSFLSRFTLRYDRTGRRLELRSPGP